MSDQSNAAERPSDEVLLRRRDALIDHLRSQSVPGVVSAGLSRRDGWPVLTVLVKSGQGARIPDRFEGTPVIVNRVASARAF